MGSEVQFSFCCCFPKDYHLYLHDRFDLKNNFLCQGCMKVTIRTIIFRFMGCRLIHKNLIIVFGNKRWPSSHSLLDSFMISMNL